MKFWRQQTSTQMIFIVNYGNDARSIKLEERMFKGLKSRYTWWAWCGYSSQLLWTLSGVTS
jgi:hypothetical protein